MMVQALRIAIRPERPGELPAIARVHHAAFPTSLEADLVDALREAGDLTASLVALGARGIVGHIAFSGAEIVGANGATKVAWLAPLAVYPEYQRQGTGSALVETGIEACKAKNLDAVVVVGAPGLYGRFGFSQESASALRSRWSGSHLLALPLGAQALAGTLTEPDAFSSLA